jgi:hypothetical protein
MIVTDGLVIESFTVKDIAQRRQEYAAHFKGQRQKRKKSVFVRSGAAFAAWRMLSMCRSGSA